MKFYINIFILFLVCRISSAQDGVLDNTFGTGGKRNIDFGMTNDYAHTLAVQNNGKIVVGGKTHNGTNFDFALIRLNSDGSLDNTFGTGGYVVTPIQNGNDFIKAIKIQNDGKILVAGTTYYGTWIQDFCVVRYNSNGTLDNTFGTNGIVITDIGSITEFANSMVLQADGKIIVAGHTSVGVQNDFAVVRYNSNGSLDNSFGINGIVKTDIGSSNDEAYNVAIQIDGKILVAGGSYNGSNFDFAVVRYNSDGSLDNTFNSSGKYTYNFYNYYDMAYSVLVQPDNKIIVSGTAENIGSNRDFACIRLNSDGSNDNTFGTNGKVSVNMMTTNDFCYSAVLQSDDKILLCGYTDYSLSILRLNSNGSIDYTFDDDGKVLTGVGGNWSESNSIAMQSDGKILVAGNGYFVNMMVQTYDFVVARYLNNSLLPVELLSFTARINSFDQVQLIWKTATEVNNYGFEIERAVTLRQAQDDNRQAQSAGCNADDNRKEQNDNVTLSVSKGEQWQKLGFVQGYGNSNSQKNYTFTDNTPPTGKVQYRLKQIDNDGSFKYSDVIEVNVDAPAVTEVFQNYPNPFNPSTSIKFNLNKESKVKIIVYDILGSVVRELVNEVKPVGSYIVYWNSDDNEGRKVASGVYFYRLEASDPSSNSGQFIQIRKMNLVR